jgi:tetratricopeptide (TPR) repeat protein
MATELDLLDIQAELLDREAHRTLHEARFADAIPISRDAFEVVEKLENREAGAHALTEVVIAQCLLGDLDKALVAADTQLAYGSKYHVATFTKLVRNIVAGISYIRRDMHTVELMLSQVPLDYPMPPPGILRAVRLAEQGELEGGLSILDELPKVAPLESVHPTGRAFYYGLLARIEFISGDEQAARNAFTSWLAAVDEIPRELGMYRLGALMPPASLDHRRGDLALQLDLVDEAEGHYRTGLDWTEREGCFIEAGRCLNGLARVAKRRGRQDEAMQHLDRAAGIFEQHGAQLYLDQVRSQRDSLVAEEV